MTPRQAHAFVRKNGVVLEAASGPVPSLAEAIAGAPLRGSWWAHPRGREIFKLTHAVRASKDVLVCRLVNGRVTYVHRRLWPALVRAALRFSPGQLAQVREIHTPAGRHAVSEVAFPDWVPHEVSAEASELSEEQAVLELGAWARTAGRQA